MFNAVLLDRMCVFLGPIVKREMDCGMDSFAVSPEVKVCFDLMLK